ncbi:MAG: hypothetical protein J0H88_08325 [Sphingomonadales bacterium]|nr:hypothetical protein [Sphingomonadales bacterium]
MNDAIKHLIAAARDIVPAIVPGAAPAIQLGKAILDALEAGKDLVTPGDQADYGETREALRAKVLAHFDSTIAGLRGEG